MYAENVYDRWIQSLYGICLSARWTHTPLSLKRGVWLSIMDGGPPGVHLTAYYDCIMHVIYLDIKQARFSICLLNSTVIQLDGVLLAVKLEWWSVSGDWCRTGTWLCCRLCRTMLPRRTCTVGNVLVLVLCLSSAEDFDWTKNDHGSFYYGTFPTGNKLFFEILTVNGDI